MRMTEDGTCGIYKITKKDTGQAYIGLSENIERRWYDHTHSPQLKHSYIDRAIKKYGADRFDLEIIEELPNDRDLLTEREAYWVKYYNTYKDDFHYNLTPGGDFSPMKVPEIAKKNSESNKGREFSEEHKKNISEANSGENNPMYGKKHTLEAKAKMSKAKSGKNHPFYGKKGEESPFYGRKHTLEAKAKMSKAKSGENNPMYGEKHSEDAMIKMSRAQNTTGFFRVYKRKNPAYKQGFTYAYKYYGDDKKQHSITSVSLEKLEQKVKAKGLEWFKFDNNNGE